VLSPSSGVRGAQVVGGAASGPARHRPSSSSRPGPQSVSHASSGGGGGGVRLSGVRGAQPQTASVTSTGSELGLKGGRLQAVNGWSPSQQSDVFTYASDTETSSSPTARERWARFQSIDSLNNMN